MALSWRAPALAALTAALLLAGAAPAVPASLPVQTPPSVPCFAGRVLLSPCPRYP